MDAWDFQPLNAAELELRDALLALERVLEEPDVPLLDLLEIIPGPDFPTGGIICGRRGIQSAYRSGRGVITLRAKTSIEEGKAASPEIETVGKLTKSGWVAKLVPI